MIALILLLLASTMAWGQEKKSPLAHPKVYQEYTSRVLQDYQECQARAANASVFATLAQEQIARLKEEVAKLKADAEPKKPDKADLEAKKE